MATTLNPYLNFRGNARAAMEFYQSVLGGELTVSSFADLMGDTGPEAEQVMHSQLTTPAGFTLMGSDTPSHMSYAVGVNDFSVSLSGDDEAELTGYWEKLAVGATISQPLETAPWGASFGMLVDTFGVNWLVNISGPASP